jgi:hypothetical protein
MKITNKMHYIKGKATNKMHYIKGKATNKMHYIKGKAIPLQAWTGPEGCRRLRLPDFKTVGT